MMTFGQKVVHELMAFDQLAVVQLDAAVVVEVEQPLAAFLESFVEKKLAESALDVVPLVVALSDEQVVDLQDERTVVL